MELSKLFIQRRFMKKYSQLFLLSNTILGVFSAQLTAQASEADNAQKAQIQQFLLATLPSMFLEIQLLLTTHAHRHKFLTPFTTLFGLMKMGKTISNGILRLRHPLQLLICVSTLVMEPFMFTLISISMEKWLV